MKSFELASTTPISVDELRGGVSRALEGVALYQHYVKRDRGAAASALLEELDRSADTLEEHARALKGQRERLFTLVSLFRAQLGGDRAETDVPGHGTVGDVGVADGTLSVHENLVVDGTLLVAGDLVVGGQLVVAEGAQVLVGGNMQIAAMISEGDVTTAADLHAMFVDVTGAGHSLDVGGELDSFLLIQDQQRVVVSSLSVGLHAVLPKSGDPQEVFLPTVIRNGSPDHMAIARAARAGEDVFVEGYHPPTPGEHDALEVLD